MALTGPEFLKKWTGAAAGAVMGATAILTPFSAAQAGDPLSRETKEEFLAAGELRPGCDTPEGFACATPGFEAPMELSDILASESLIRDRVIFHFGGKFYDADLAAEVASDADVPTIAIPGGPEGLMQVIIDGKTNDKAIYTQSQLNRGAVNAGLERIYSRLMARKYGPQVQGPVSASSISYDR